MPNILTILVVVALVVSPCLGTVYLRKHLAGPPTEFSHFAMPAPEASQVASMANRMPIQLSAPASGDAATQQWKAEIPVDSEFLFTLTLLSPLASNMTVTVQAPGAPVDVDILTLAGQPIQESYGIDGASFPSLTWTFNTPAVGVWTVSVSCPTESVATLLRATSSNAQGYMIAANTSPYKAWSALENLSVTTGESFDVEVLVFDTDKQEYDHEGKLFHARPVPMAASSMKATLRVVEPDGTEVDVPMNDEGINGDDVAGDLTFEATLTASQAGYYSASVLVEGTDPMGRPFARTVEHLMVAVTDTVSVGGSAMATVDSVDEVVVVTVPLKAQNGALASDYKVWGEVWGHDATGASVPVSWVSTIANVVTDAQGAPALSLEMSTRYIARAGAVAPFSLQKLRVQCVQTSIIEELVQTLPITIDSANAAALNNVLSRPTHTRSSPITKRMRLGRVPHEHRNRFYAAKGAAACSKNTMGLIHGYCAQGNPFTASDFTNYSVFLGGINQNLSHDQFARKILDWEAQNAWECFSLVAHSQGGAASLHLLTYYWSGLDLTVDIECATIQSVGTPYQGCSLAGSLAGLGDIFGVGCGQNTDLSPSGASVWLAGIPSERRDNVVFYLTRYRTSGLVKYCNLAANAVLSWPNDGTTELDRGDLPGGLFGGTKSAWCHTSGMKDPPQCTDASRNVLLNNDGCFCA